MQTFSAHRAQRLGEALRSPRASRETYDWTDERIEILKSLWSTGKSASEISAQLPGALTRNAVIGKIHRLGLSTRKTTTRKRYNRQAPMPKPSKKPFHLGSTAFRGPQMEALPLPVATAADLPNVKLVDLEPHHCRWPSGAPVEGFCGCDKVDGLPYCSGHAQRAYAAPQPRPRPIFGLVAHVMRSDVEVTR